MTYDEIEAEDARYWRAVARERSDPDQDDPLTVLLQEQEWGYSKPEEDDDDA